MTPAVSSPPATDTAVADRAQRDISASANIPDDRLRPAATARLRGRPVGNLSGVLNRAILSVAAISWSVHSEYVAGAAVLTVFVLVLVFGRRI